MANQTPQATQIVISLDLQSKAKYLVGNVGLTEVSMLSGTFQRLPLMDLNPIPVLMINGQIQTTINIFSDGLSAQAIFVITGFGKQIDEQPDNQFGFKIEASYRLSYQAKDIGLEPELRAEALQAMVAMSATNHVWPFWREFAMQASQRMNIPPVMIPLLFTIPAAQPKPPRKNPVPAKRANAAQKAKRDIPKKPKIASKK